MALAKTYFSNRFTDLKTFISKVTVYIQDRRVRSEKASDT